MARDVSSELPLFANRYLTMGRKPIRPATALDSIAERLRISREALGYTPTTIARLIGSPSSFWHNCESGQRRISVDKALALKRATGLTLEWIYAGEFSTLPGHLAEKIERQRAKERAAEKHNGTTG